MSTLLVTGGAGFIGSHLVRRLLQRGDMVVNLDSLTYAGSLATIADVANHPRHQFVQGDIGDVALLRQLFAEHRFDGVVNLAAETHVDRSIDNGGPFVTTNVTGAFRLLEIAREYWQKLPEPEQAAFRFIQVSTDEVYGPQLPGKRAKTTSPYQPSSYYSATKAAADHLALAAFRTYGLPTIISHGTNTFGPYQYPEKLIPRMILNCLAGRELPIYGDGLHERDWIHVDDHAEGLLRVLDAGEPGESYHLGTGFERPNLSVVKEICECVDEMCPDLPHDSSLTLLRHVADRPGHDRRYALDVSSSERALSWRAVFEFRERLVETVAWYRANSAWCEEVTRGRYDGRRLGAPPVRP